MIPGTRRGPEGTGWKGIPEEVYPGMEAPPEQALLLKGQAKAPRRCPHTAHWQPQQWLNPRTTNNTDKLVLVRARQTGCWLPAEKKPCSGQWARG